MRDVVTATAVLAITLTPMVVLAENPYWGRPRDEAESQAPMALPADLRTMEPIKSPYENPVSRLSVIADQIKKTLAAERAGGANPRRRQE